jgi:hypothetical protein
METHKRNLFRNVNEFQHRAHSFGVVGNFVPFFAALLLYRRTRARWAPLLFGSFAFFVAGHSALHWYGWKWEPRMLYDISFLFFAASALGVHALWDLGREGGVYRKVFGAILAGVFLWLALRDLPWRFRTEYQDYNDAPTGVLDEVRRTGLRDAIIQFRTGELYACYMPQNTLTFDGSVVYAKNLGALENYRLYRRFPEKRVFFSPDGMTLEPRENFFRRDLDTLASTLRASGASEIDVVLPWLDLAPTPLHDRLPGTKLSSDTFVESLGRLAPEAGRPRLVALVGEAVSLAELLPQMFETRPVPLTSETRVALLWIDRRRTDSAARFPGFRVTCWEDIHWKGRILKQGVVAGIDNNVCPGENRSIQWEAELALREEVTLPVYLESDDGSGLFVDGELLVDNELTSGHGVKEVNGKVRLAPGLRRIVVKYFNGPSEGRMEAGLKLPDGTRERFSVSLKPAAAYFHVPADPAPTSTEPPR